MKITVEWGYEEHSITLTPSDWAKVISGEELVICGDGYDYEGEVFDDFWHFTGGLEGDLIVTYSNAGDDSGTGFDGKLRDAHITDPNESRAETQPTEKETEEAMLSEPTKDQVPDGSRSARIVEAFLHN
jgi:hypothetical protein